MVLSVSLNFIPGEQLKKRVRCFYYNLRNKLSNIKCSIGCFPDYFVFEFADGISFRLPSDIWTLRQFWSRTPHMLNGDLGRYKLRKGDVAIDCGAYVGVFTLYAAKAVGEQGCVIAFEPDPANYERLKRNLELNSMKNVILVKKGVWGSTTVLEFSSEATGKSSVFVGGKQEKNIIRIPVTTIDEEMRAQGIGRADFIKMDIEGAELEALKAARETLGRNSVNLAIASNHIVDNEKTSGRVEKILRDFGYDAETAYPAHLTTYGKKKQA